MAFFFKIVKIIAKLDTINSLVIQEFPYGLGFIRCKMVPEIEAVLNNVFLALERMRAFGDKHKPHNESN